MTFWKQLLTNTLASFIGALLALAAAGAFIWWRFTAWLNSTPWGDPMVINGVREAIDKSYADYWLPLLILSGVFAVEGAAIAWGLWRLKDKGG